MAAAAAAAKSNWGYSETSVLINILKENNIINRLDGRKIRNADLFKTVHEKLKEAGVDRTVEQIKNKWKILKTAYYKAKLNNNRSGMDPSSFPFFEEMDEVMGGRPLSNVTENGVDVGFEEPPDVENLAETSISVSDDDEHSISEATEKDPTQTTQDPCEGSSHATDLPVQSTAKKRIKSKSASGYERALKTWAIDQQAFLHNLQSSQNRWAEQQQEQNRQHEERMFFRFVEENTRTTQHLIGQLFEGLRGILHDSSQAAAHWQHYPYTQPQHPYSHSQSYQHPPHDVD
ncbi:hypothetical protein QQF64_034380 [Cirrhinus molitorella]|uniref:Myb/SANT-like DNA-binding domain-containing protein n=1 Tax=Cirrhinus molitorella TaxID=172907 RepID=A0ABR3L3K3_9TELE